VIRQGFSLLGAQAELTLEARNITGTGYREYQERDGNVVDINRYDIGTSGSIGISLRF
jgi:hypothetical protein